jgi:hypothetical protein
VRERCSVGSLKRETCKEPEKVVEDRRGDGSVTVCVVCKLVARCFFSGFFFRLIVMEGKEKAAGTCLAVANNLKFVVFS